MVRSDFLHPEVCSKCIYGYHFGPTEWREPLCLMVITLFEFVVAVVLGVMVTVLSEVERSRGQTPGDDLLDDAAEGDSRGASKDQ